MTDQCIGILDSEEKQSCSLPVNANTGATGRTVLAANPGASLSRRRMN